MKKFILATSLSIISLLISAQTNPDTTAGVADQEPGFLYENTKSQGILNGTPYYYRRSDSLFVTISTLNGVNNGSHGMHKGAIMDVIQTRAAYDNLDWTQFLLNSSTHGSWNLPNQNPDLDSIWVSASLDTVFASGYTPQDSTIKFIVAYSFLSDTLPILKIDINLINEGSTTYSGYLQYQIDPDGTYQHSWAAGVGRNPGYISNGWIKNYLYTGPMDSTFSNLPSHGIAWLTSKPVALVGLNYLNGVWFNADVNAGDTTLISLYHISNNSTYKNFNLAQECIGQYADKLFQYDTSYSNSYRLVRGRVEDVHGVPVKNAVVKIKNTSAELINKITTDTAGNYSTFIPKDVYTFTISSLGYLTESRSIDASIDSVLDFTIAEGFALTPTDVWAGTGKEIPGSALTITGDQDIILENDKIAVAFGTVTNRSQLKYASKGNPLDLIVKDEPVDYIDWIEINKLSFNNDTTEDWWSNQHVMNDTIYVGSVTSSSATVIAEGRYFRHKDSSSLATNEALEVHFGNDSLVFRTDIEIITTYSIEPGNYFFNVETEIRNKASQTINLWAGDVLDFDGSGQTSYVPGIGDINGDWGTSADFTFTPSAPWFAQYGSSLPAVGLIYEGDYADSAIAYGVYRWMSLKNQIQIGANSSYFWNRKVAIKSSLGFPTKPAVIADIYSNIKQNETGFSYQLNINEDTVYTVGDTIALGITFFNSLDSVDIDSIQFDVISIENIELLSATTSFLINGIPADSSLDTTIYFRALSGGRGLNTVQITDSANNFYESLFSTSITGPGWYAGDNHTHSLFSDGVGTIAENAKAAYDRGMSFMTSTDHNTVNQKSAVDVENVKYKDMVMMTGEEVTTNRGHALAYNTGRLIPWNLNNYTEQDLIDSTNNSTTQYGNGFMYLAHPHYPGLPWQNYSVRNHTGLEVWNGFYSATHSVNALTFDDWDSLNTLGLRLFGISNSDAHNPAVVAKNYIVAYLDSLTKEEIISVMRDKGCYYGSNGPRINFTSENTLMGGDIKVPSSGRNVIINVSANSNSDQNIDYVRVIMSGNEIKRWTPSASNDFFDTLHVNASPGDFIRMEMKSGTGFAYSNPIWFSLGSSNATIDSVYINNQLFAPFDTAIYTYIYPTIVTVSPSITVLPADTNATLTIDYPLDINSANAADRTATITITSEDKSTVRVYTIEFNNQSVGINQESEIINTFNVFPIPAKNQIQITTENYGAISFEILTIQGVTVLNGEMKGRLQQVDVSSLNRGIYIVRLIHKNGSSKNKRIILN